MLVILDDGKMFDEENGTSLLEIDAVNLTWIQDINDRKIVGNN